MPNKNRSRIIKRKNIKNRYIFTKPQASNFCKRLLQEK